MANTFLSSNPNSNFDSNNTSSLGQLQSGVVVNNGVGQICLNRRLNKHRKNAEGVLVRGHSHGSDQIHTRTSQISSSVRNCSPWFRALGLADDHVGPVQISFSNTSIGDSNHVNRETKSVRAKFLQASTSSHTNGTHNRKKKAGEMSARLLLASATPTPPCNTLNSVIVDDALRLKRSNHPTAVDGVNNMNNNVVSDDVVDGQIRSLPYQKNGPYICPRCNQQLSSPQRFAAHARSHYKYESKAQRKSRLMSKIRKRDLCFQMINGQLILAPVSSDQAGEARNMNNTRFAHSGGHELINVKVEVDQVGAAPLLE